MDVDLLLQCRQWIAVSERMDRERMRWFSTEEKKEKEDGKGETRFAEGQTPAEEEALETEEGEEGDTQTSSKEDVSKLFRAILNKKDAALEELSLQVSSPQYRTMDG